MSGLSKKVEEMGFKWVDTEWRVAWDMTPKEGDFIIKQVKKKPEAVPNTKECPQCRSAIPLNAMRCKFCTQPVA